jgi:catechol 2,3-dioxygenase-like lactoylglutathione lyase family enzyme
MSRFRTTSVILARRLSLALGLVAALAGGSVAESKPDVRFLAYRAIVTDVDAAIEFYTRQLGFTLITHPAPGFAALSLGELKLLLNAPGVGGAGQRMSDGRKPEPGGWNRLQLEVEDLSATVRRLKKASVRFRNDIVIGNGGKQILMEDPSGNPIELFEASQRPAGGAPQQGSSQPK